VRTSEAGTRETSDGLVRVAKDDDIIGAVRGGLTIRGAGVDGGGYAPLPPSESRTEGLICTEPWRFTWTDMADGLLPAKGG